MIFTTNQKYEQAILSTLLYIQTHLEQDLSLGVLAERVGFSAFHFHRIFREAIGEPVKEYTRRLRLERGAIRLKISEQTILQIALDSGFKTHESFTRAFERQFGITPSEYRSNFMRGSREHKKHVQPRYIADYNMQDESGLLPSGCLLLRNVLTRQRRIQSAGCDDHAWQLSSSRVGTNVGGSSPQLSNHFCSLSRSDGNCVGGSVGGACYQRRRASASAPYPLRANNWYGQSLTRTHDGDSREGLRQFLCPRVSFANFFKPSG